MPSTPSYQGATPLRHLGVIRARGADAASFLQGQLTNDVLSLGADRARPAGYCSAKGRLQASFWVLLPAADELLLVCAADLLAATLKRLSMFVLRAKCRLEDASAGIELLGVAGDAAAACGGEPWQVRESALGAATLRLPDAAGCARAVVVGTPTDAARALPALSLDAWRWLDVHAGVPLIEAATVDRFVPQMLNYELVGGVDFKKGCYPGQEVVARSQYRGTIKRRMFLFDCGDALAAGMELFDPRDPGQPAGMVVNAAPRPEGAGSSALAEVKLAALDGGGVLHAGRADGPALAPRALPYALPDPALETQS